MEIAEFTILLGCATSWLCRTESLKSSIYANKTRVWTTDQFQDSRSTAVENIELRAPIGVAAVLAAQKPT